MSLTETDAIELLEALEELHDICGTKKLSKVENKTWQDIWKRIEEAKVEGGYGIWCEECDGFVDGMECTEYGTCNDCQADIEAEQEDEDEEDY